MADLTRGRVLSSLLAVSVPIIITNLLQTAYQMTDTFWVGRLGAEAVAAVSLTFPVLFFAFSIGIGLSIASTVLIAHAWGRGDREAADRIATQSMVAMVFVSLVLVVLGSLFAESIMVAIGVEGEVLLLATEYLRISFLGIPLLFVFAAYQSIMRGIGEVRAPLIIVLVTVLLNLVLDPLFIYGWGSVPALGVAGAAMASVVTQGLSAVIGVVLLARSSAPVRIHARFVPIALDVQRRIFSLGIPSSLDVALRSLSLLIMAFIVAGFSTEVIAAYGIGQNIFSFVVIPALGLSIAVSAMVGQNVGAGRFDRVHESVRLASRIGFVSLSVLGVGVVFFAPWIIGFFVPGDPVVIELGSVFLRITALTFGLIGLHLVISGALRGVGRPEVSLWISAISLFAIKIPLAWFLSQSGLLETGIWISVAVANVAGAAIALWWVSRIPMSDALL